MCHDSFSNYLNLSVISTAVWFPHTLFPVGLWYYTCLTCFGAFSFVSLVSFSPWISHNALLSFHSQKSRLTFYSLDSSGSTLPSRPFAPSVSSWTRHSLWSFTTNFSLSTIPSLGSLRTGNAWHSWHAIGSWDARETHWSSLKIKMICSLMWRRRKSENWKLKTER